MGHLAPHNEWNELQAAERSEWLLERAEAGEPGPCTSADLERVKQDAMRAMAKDLPNPIEYARWFETVHHEAAYALCNAYRSTSRGARPYFRVADGPEVGLLRALGLIEVRGFGLGCFGNSVRSIMLGEDGC